MINERRLMSNQQNTTKSAKKDKWYKVDKSIDILKPSISSA